MENKSDSKNILVTGGAGYIGSHTVRELIKSGFKVAIYDNLIYGHKEFVPSDTEFIEGDLCDKQKLDSVFSSHSFDAVIHFAAYAYVGESVKEPSKYFNNNISNGIKLLDTMKEFGVKNIVFSSSCSTYGNPESIPITEDAPRHPVNPYGFSKFVFENILDAYEDAYGIRSVSLRYFNAAGAMPDSTLGEWHDPETHAIPLMFKALEKGEFNIFGGDYPTPDGTCIRDYVHVCDLADAHVKALHHLIDGNPTIKLNLGTGKGTSVSELIKIIEEITGRRLSCKVAKRRQGDPPELVADPSKAVKILGWSPRYSIKDIIKHVWLWEQKRKHNTHNKLSPD